MKKLREYLKENNLTDWKFADFCNVASATVTRASLHNKTRSRRLVEMCKKLNIYMRLITNSYTPELPDKRLDSEEEKLVNLQAHIIKKPKAILAFKINEPSIKKIKSFCDSQNYKMKKIFQNDYHVRFEVTR